jgi:hypothetical protein
LPAPPAADQIRFLTNIQRLLSEGLFTATYKYALLSALADLSVEHGDDSGGSLEPPQSLPYAGSEVLRQNTGRSATVLTLVQNSLVD